MHLGFVSAILGDLSLEDVLGFAGANGFGCVEIMCWPPGKANRRYAGVTHLDVTNLTVDQAVKVNASAQKHGVTISGLGYYSNPLDPDPGHRQVVIDHLKNVIDAAALLGVPIVNTFIGRDPTKSVDDNWPLLKSVWPDVIRHVEARGVKLAIENCGGACSKSCRRRGSD